MDISYDYYRIFYYVAKYGNITRAAKILFNNQPNLTRAVKALESELGCPLFIRSNRGMTLTPEGSCLFDHVRVAFESIEAGEAEILERRNLEKGSVFVAASEVALHCVLLPVLKEYRSLYPGIRLKISNHSTPQAADAIKNGTADIAVVTTPTLPAAAIEEISVCKFREAAVCGSAFSDLFKSKISFAELLAHPIISLGPHTKSFELYSRFFAGEGAAPGNYVFLVDEAHNLVDRASSMYSAQIIKEDFLELKKLTSQYGGRLSRYLGKCNRELLELKKVVPGDGYGVLGSIAGLHLKLLGLHDAMEAFLEEHRQFPERSRVLEFYFNLTSFLNIAELVDENYVIYDEILADGRFMVKLYCVKPSANIGNCLDKGLATVFFSATILPVRYYMEMLSDSPEDQAIYIRSPFPKENRRILIANDVTTRYTRRNDEQYGKISDYIKNVVDSKPGNYMVFFPSYAMLEKVGGLVGEETFAYDVRVISQTPYMTEADRESFLEAFESDDNVLAMCIMGGIFSEGIDLTGDRLIGAVVVGPGLPQVCTERKLMMDYFDSRDGASGSWLDSDGFKYSYQYPGVNKVLQAAGRVIRTETDQGVILLLDDRFATHRYSGLFPVEWDDYSICSHSNVREQLDEFWDSKS